MFEKERPGVISHRAGTASSSLGCLFEFLRRPDSNRRPTGYEPAELPLLHAAQKSIAVENLPRNPSPRNPADSLYFTLRRHWESMSSKDFP